MERGIRQPRAIIRESSGMLIKATIEDIKKYGDFAYNLALNPEKSSYPTYADGIKTKEDFLDAAKKAAAEETSGLLLFVTDGKVDGWISYFRIPEEKYLQLDGCNIARGTEQALTELLNTLETRFAGYTAYFGYPGENVEAVEFLRTHGFSLIEENWNCSFFFDGYKSVTRACNVEKITRKNFDKFRAVYRADPETYWNCDRIYERIDDWTIFVYNDGDTPIATIFFTGDDGYYEIFGAEFIGGIFREHAFRELLTASLNECGRMGAKYMTYFCGDEEKRILREFDFKCVGKYLLYIKVLGL